MVPEFPKLRYTAETLPVTLSQHRCYADEIVNTARNTGVTPGLEDNKIGLRGVANLCDVLSEHSYVKHLNLSGNGLKDPTAVVLGEMLKVNYTLTCLIVKQNQFR